MYIGVSLGILGMLSDTVTKMLAPQCCGNNKEREALPRSTSYGSNKSSTVDEQQRTQQRVEHRRASLLKLPSRQLPVPFRINAIAVLLLSLACVFVVEFVFPTYQGKSGIGMPVWGTVVVILYSFCCAYGCSVVYVRMLVGGVVGGWWLVVGGWWLVAGNVG